MPTKTYKGYTITARPYQAYITGQWTIDLRISRHSRHRAFTSRDHALTEGEAVAASLALGRRIIDGEIPGSSVAKLR